MDLTVCVAGEKGGKDFGIDLIWGRLWNYRPLEQMGKTQNHQTSHLATNQPKKEPPTYQKKGLKFGD